MSILREIQKVKLTGEKLYLIGEGQVLRPHEPVILVSRLFSFNRTLMPLLVSAILDKLPESVDKAVCQCLDNKYDINVLRRPRCLGEGFLVYFTSSAANDDVIVCEILEEILELFYTSNHCMLSIKCSNSICIRSSLLSLRER